MTLTRFIKDDDDDDDDNDDDDDEEEMSTRAEHSSQICINEHGG